MKIVSAILRITAIALNTFFLAYVLVQVGTYGFESDDLLVWIGMILIFTCLPVSLITVVFTFLKKMQVFTAALKIITIVLNVALFVCLICLAVTKGVDAEGFGRWLLVLLMFGFPLVNFLAILLTLRKAKPITAGQRPEN